MRRRGSEKRDPLAAGRRGRGPGPPRSARIATGEKGSRAGVAVAKPQRRWSPEPGARKGVAGRRSLLDGRCPGTSSTTRIVHAGGSRRSRRLPRPQLRASGGVAEGEATGMPEVRSARIATGTTSPRGDTTERVRPTEANRSAVRQAISPVAGRASARRNGNRRGAGARTKTWEGRSRSDASRVVTHEEPQGESAARRWPRGSPHTVLTHAVAAPRRERCARFRGAFNQEGAWDLGGRGNPVDRDTTEGVPIVARVVPQGAARWRSRLRGSTWSAHREVRVEPASDRSWNRLGGARDGDEGRQRLTTCKVKAAPADEARVVRHARRREAPAPGVLPRGFRGRAKAEPRSSEPWTGRSKLAGANS